MAIFHGRLNLAAPFYQVPTSQQSCLEPCRRGTCNEVFPKGEVRRELLACHCIITGQNETACTNLPFLNSKATVEVVVFFLSLAMINSYIPRIKSIIIPTSYIEGVAEKCNNMYGDVPYLVHKLWWCFHVHLGRRRPSLSPGWAVVW